MRRVNIADPEFRRSGDSPPGFQPASFRMGPLVGARILGATVYELPPGQSICAYYYEYGEEEWLIVLQGSPLVRHPQGEDRLDPWDVVCFPAGPDGGHAVRNDGDATVRVLMFSNVIHPAATVYPDSDKVAVWTGNEADNVMVRKSSRVDYWDGEASRCRAAGGP
jgi:uncharacterized cupin superfamily protein